MTTQTIASKATAPHRLLRLIVLLMLCLLLIGGVVLGMLWLQQEFIAATAPNGPPARSPMPKMVLAKYGQRQLVTIPATGDEIILVYKSSCPYCRQILPDVLHNFEQPSRPPAELILIQADNQNTPPPEVATAGWHGDIYRDPERMTKRLLNVNRVPTFLHYRNGILEGSYLGVAGWEELQSALRK